MNYQTAREELHHNLGTLTNEDANEDDSDNAIQAIIGIGIETLIDGAESLARIAEAVETNG